MSRWGGMSSQVQPADFPPAKKKRRSRWTEEDKTIIPGMPTVIPAGMTPLQEKQYLLQLQIEEISRTLRSGDLGISPNPEARSPSPEPIYNNEGKRLNTREYRTRKKLEEDRHKCIQEMLFVNPEYKPPPDYKPPIIRITDKVFIPQEEHPDINFVGLLIGPRGNTLKNLEKETGAKIIIRGKGSVKEGKIGRKDGQPMPGEDEPLHAYITATTAENVQRAVNRIKDIIKQGIEVPEGQNDLRRQQLRELAQLNGTLRENDGLAKLKQIAESRTIITNNILCTLCGGAGHIAQDCRVSRKPGDAFKAMQHHQQQQSLTNPADKARMDSEYMSLMAELGEAPPPDKSGPRPLLGPKQPLLQTPHHQPQAPPHQQYGGPPPLMSQPTQPPPQYRGGAAYTPPNHSQPPPGYASRPPVSHAAAPPPARSPWSQPPPAHHQAGAPPAPSPYAQQPPHVSSAPSALPTSAVTHHAPPPSSGGSVGLLPTPGPYGAAPQHAPPPHPPPHHQQHHHPGGVPPPAQQHAPAPPQQQPPPVSHHGAVAPPPPPPTNGASRYAAAPPPWSSAPPPQPQQTPQPQYSAPPPPPQHHHYQQPPPQQPWQPQHTQQQQQQPWQQQPQRQSLGHHPPPPPPSSAAAPPPPPPSIPPLMGSLGAPPPPPPQ